MCLFNLGGIYIGNMSNNFVYRVAHIGAGSSIQLEYHRKRLTVDTTLIDCSALRVGDYRHVLGHLRDNGSGTLTLHARILVDVDGIDPGLYDRCFAMRLRLDNRISDDK